MKKLHKFYAITFVFLFFPFSIVSSGFAKTTSPAVDTSASTGKILVRKGTISVNVKDVPLGDVLRQIAEQCNLRIKGKKSVLQEKVSLWFEELPLEQGLNRILASFNYCLMFDSDSKLAGAIIICSEGAATGLQLSQGRLDSAVSMKPEYPPGHQDMVKVKLPLGGLPEGNEEDDYPAGAREIVKVEGILGEPPEEEVYPTGASDTVNVKPPPGGPAEDTEDNVYPLGRRDMDKVKPPPGGPVESP